MKCPVCDVNLAIADRQGVEIDYCPQCRGVWLDRGELDKIIERSEREEWRPTAPQYQQQQEYRQPQHGGHAKPKRKKNILSELFEFGD